MNLFKKVSALDAAKNIVFAFSAAKIIKKLVTKHKKQEKNAQQRKVFCFCFVFYRKNDYLCRRYPEYNLFTLKEN